jgi:hypothetical protein
MDPLSGLLGLTTLSIGSLAFLHWKKQQREGFNPVPTEDYPVTVENSQTVYNPLSQLLNPFMNGLVSINPSQSDQTNVQNTARQALEGVEADYSLNNTETLNAQISRYFTEPRIEKQGGLLESIQFCREEGKKTNPFSNPRFATSCGVCLTDGTDEEGNTFTGPRGLFVSEKEKEAATREKNTTGGLYVKLKPALGMCTGAPDQPVFATNEKELSLFQKRRECQTKKVVGDGCGVCLNTQTYSYLDKDTDKQSMFFVLAGTGKVTVKVNGKVIEQEDTVLNANTPIKFDLGNEEGSRFEILVKKDPRALLYGYLEAMMPNRGVFRVSLQRIVEKDTETGSTPSVEPPSYRFQSTGVLSAKLKNANTKDQLRVTGILPFTFSSPGEFVSLDCPSSPFQSKKESLAAISQDPCATRGANGYSNECLLEKIYDAGCTNNGTLVQDPSQVNQYGTTLDAIVQKLQDIKSKDGVMVAESKLCSGSEPKTPCEEALLNPNAPISAACLLYLYTNRGAGDNRIGATYVGNETLASRQSDGTLQYCLPSGTLSPIASNGSPNQQAIDLLNQRALQGFNSLTGVKAVQAFLNSVFAEAVNTSKRMDDPTRAIAIQQCFSQVSAVPSATLASPPRSIANSVWITSRDGFMYKYENNGWVKQSQQATTLSVSPSNQPWYLTTGYSIFRPSGTNSYGQVSGAATDIGVGANGDVWVIGTGNAGGGKLIYKFIPFWSYWQNVAGGALRVAVDPNGNAWVINNADQLFQWTGSGWNYISTATGKDIGISSNGTVFVMQSNKILFKKPSDLTWASLDGPVGKTLLRISADANANPYVVTNDYKLFQYNGTYWSEISTPSQGVLDVGVGTT